MYLEDSVGLEEEVEWDFNERAGREGMTEAERIHAFNRDMSRLGLLANNPAEFEREFVERVEGGEKGNGRWLIADFEAGDVVFHCPCSVHASCNNQDEVGRIRLSTDLTFYSKKDWDEGRADEWWMKVWGPGDGL